METPNYTLWVDCEFTGLSIDKDLLLEIGAVVTKGLFVEVESYEAVASHSFSNVENRMAQDDWWSSRPAMKARMLADVEDSTKTLETIDTEIAKFVGRYAAGGIVPAGNSLGTDRKFIARDLAQLHALLHYRTIDVSSFKEVARRFGIEEYKKTEQHRAIADIHESIDELRYLLAKLGAPAVQ